MKSFLLSIETVNIVVMFREKADVVASCVWSVDRVAEVVESPFSTLGKVVDETLGESVVRA